MTKISDASLVSTVDGTEQMPTGEVGDKAISVDQIKDYVLDNVPAAGVQSVTGDGVDNTDPDNPVLSYPTPADIGAVDGSGTTNEIAYFSAATTLASLTTATYPSLTELSYVKGLTSSATTPIAIVCVFSPLAVVPIAIAPPPDVITELPIAITPDPMLEVPVFELIPIDIALPPLVPDVLPA